MSESMFDQLNRVCVQISKPQSRATTSVPEWLSVKINNMKTGTEAEAKPNLRVICNDD